MALFEKDRRQESHHARKIYAAWELVYTFVDFFAAAAFLVGSILFLYENLQTIATWFFIVGSALFAFKPTIRTVREIKLAAMGDTGDLAEMEKEE